MERQDEERQTTPGKGRKTQRGAIVFLVAAFVLILVAALAQTLSAW